MGDGKKKKRERTRFRAKLHHNEFLGYLMSSLASQALDPGKSTLRIAVLHVTHARHYFLGVKLMKCECISSVIVCSALALAW